MHHPQRGDGLDGSPGFVAQAGIREQPGQLGRFM
jgi:hypothetical protein